VIGTGRGVAHREARNRPQFRLSLPVPRNLCVRPMSVDGRTRMLNHLKLRTRLACLVGLSALALIASIALGATMMHERMVSDRVDKLRAVVQTALSIAQALQTREASHELTHVEAFARFAADVHAIRFDKGDGYLTVQDTEGRRPAACHHRSDGGQEISHEGRQWYLDHRSGARRVEKQRRRGNRLPVS